MKREFEKASTLGRLLLSNSFDTPKGRYRIDIREYEGNIYFFKYRDGSLLECRNLNKNGIREVFV